MGSAYEENTCSDVFIPTFTIPRIRLSIPQAQTSIPRKQRTKFRKKGTMEPKCRTKGWNTKVETSGLAQKDEKRLRCMYLPSSVHIMIPSPSLLDSETPIGWMAFHEALWLKVRFPLYSFIRKFLSRTQHAPRYNMIFLENEKKQKQYFFYVSSQWETVDSDERLIRSYQIDTKLVIKNMASYIITLSSEAKQSLTSIQDNPPEPTSQRELWNTPRFIAFRLMRPSTLQPPTRIVHKHRAPTRPVTPQMNSGVDLKSCLMMVMNELVLSLMIN